MSGKRSSAEIIGIETDSRLRLNGSSKQQFAAYTMASPSAGRFDLGKARVYRPEQLLARFGGCHATRGSIQEFLVNPPFQRPDCLAQSGPGHPELSRGAGEAANPRDTHHKTERLYRSPHRRHVNFPG
jgi:hypothetical protein